MIITESKLKSYRSSSYKSISKSLEDFRNESRYGKVTIFLSHKHDELENLDSAIMFMKRFGVSVYVDWQDEEMPSTTSGITAVSLKKKIQECNKFILLASEGAISSKWCNWELGIGDVHKYIKNIAILPIKKDYQPYSCSEYLQIYPYIYQSDADPNSFYVKFPNGELENLITWLKA